MLFGITISSVISANAINICALNMLLDTISIILVPSSSVILNNSNISNTSMPVASCLALSTLFFQ